jgi:hypothetical protein
MAPRSLLLFLLPQPRFLPLGRQVVAMLIGDGRRQLWVHAADGPIQKIHGLARAVVETAAAMAPDDLLPRLAQGRLETPVAPKKLTVWREGESPAREARLCQRPEGQGLALDAVLAVRAPREVALAGGPVRGGPVLEEVVDVCHDGLDGLIADDGDLVCASPFSSAGVLQVNKV